MYGTSVFYFPAFHNSPTLASSLGWLGGNKVVLGGLRTIEKHLLFKVLVRTQQHRNIRSMQVSLL